jgi:hypothetical protein
MYRHICIFGNRNFLMASPYMEVPSEYKGYFELISVLHICILYTEFQCLKFFFLVPQKIEN